MVRQQRQQIGDNSFGTFMTSAEKKAPRQKSAPAVPEPTPASKKVDAPLYLQVASTLRTAIVRGIYPVGSRIPTEEDLCERFMVSRHTVREALRRLREDGLITSRQGGRPIVVPPSALNAVRLFSAEMGKDFFDHTMGTRLIIESMEMVPISKSIATQFDIPPSEEWLRVRGYRQFGEDQAVNGWNEYYIIAEFAAIGRLLPRHIGPIIPLIEDLFSEKIIKVQQSMSAVPMPAEQAATMRVEPGSPALRIVTRCQTAADRVAMINISIHPGGDVAYSIKLRDRGTSAL